MTAGELIEQLQALDPTTVVTVECEPCSSTAAHVIDGVSKPMRVNVDEVKTTVVVLTADVDYINI